MIPAHLPVDASQSLRKDNTFASRSLASNCRPFSLNFSGKERQGSDSEKVVCENDLT